MRQVSFVGSLGLALVASAGLGGVAFGHAHLTDPLPRRPAAVGTPDDPGAAGKTTGPCGSGAAFSTAGASTATLQAGAMYTFKYDETIEHPGHYRIALNPAAVNGTGAAAYILGDNLPDLTGAMPAAGYRSYTSELLVPAEVPDGNYVLQFIQVMTENPLTPTYYYSCADVVVGIPGPTPDGGGLLPDGGVELPDGGGAGGADATPGGGGGGGGGDGAGSPPGLCSYAGPSGSKPGLGLGLGLFLVGALIWRRRH